MCDAIGVAESIPGLVRGQNSVLRKEKWYE